MTEPEGPPPDFGFKYILWFIFWKSPYDTLGIIQIIVGTISVSAGGFPHPWGGICIAINGICTNLLARFKK